MLAGTAGLLAWRSTHALQEQAPAVPKEPEKAPDKAEPSKEPAKEAVKDPAKDAGAGKKTPAARTVNIDQEMLKARRVFLTGEVNDESAKVLTQQLLFLQADDPDTPVTIFINSGGGLVHSGLAILDVMTSVSMPLKTVGYGRCFSIAAVLLAAGTPGNRSAYEHTRMMIHEPSCSYPKLPASDIILKADELRNTKETLETLLSTLTGKPQAMVSDMVARDRYMSVTEAKDFGLVDTIIECKPRRS